MLVVDGSGFNDDFGVVVVVGAELLDLGGNPFQLFVVFGKAGLQGEEHVVVYNDSRAEITY